MRRRVPLVPLPAPRVRDRQPRTPPQAQPPRAQWSPPTLPAPPRALPQVRQRVPLPASPERWVPLPPPRVPRTPQMRQQELPPQLAPVQRTLLLEQRPTQAIAPPQTTA